MSAFADALDDARLEGNLSAMVAMLRDGYVPTEDEWDALEALQVKTEHRPETAISLATKAAALVRYKELRELDVPVKEAVPIVAAEFNMTAASVEYVCVFQRDARVRTAAAKLSIKKVSEDAAA